jgi:superfamily I DNA and/or RNA helicase
LLSLIHGFNVTGAGNDAFVAATEQCPDSGLASLSFSTVLIDEATQATEPASLVPLMRGCEQLILVGDQVR